MPEKRDRDEDSSFSSSDDSRVTLQGPVVKRASKEQEPAPLAPLVDVKSPTSYGVNFKFLVSITIMRLTATASIPFLSQPQTFRLLTYHLVDLNHLRRSRMRDTNLRTTTSILMMRLRYRRTLLISLKRCSISLDPPRSPVSPMRRRWPGSKQRPRKCPRSTASHSLSTTSSP